MILQVKQFSQFVARFNYEEDFVGNATTPAFKSKVTRAQYIRLLFNAEDKRLGDKNRITLYGSIVAEFIHFTDTNSLKINKLEGNIYVEASCNVRFNNKPYTLILVLRMEKVNHGYKWMLWNAFSGFIDINSNKSADTLISETYDPTLFIPPVSNELNFMHLRKIFRNKASIAPYIPNEAGNGIKALNRLVKNNTFEYLYVEKLKYYIFDIPGWVVKVEEFQRETNNSGWLISDIVKWDKPPALYMQYLHKKDN